MRKGASRVRVAALAALALAPAAAYADVDVRCDLGFGGRWVADAPTPLTVRLANSGGETLVAELKVSLSEGLGAADVVLHRSVPLGPGGSREEVFLVPGPRNWGAAAQIALTLDPAVPIHGPRGSSDRGSIEITLEPSSADAARFAPFEARVLGVVGDARGIVRSRLDAARAARDSKKKQEPETTPEAMSVPAEVLRFAPFVLEGFDALLLCDPGAEIAERPATEDALLDWVATGGTLAISLGEHAAAFAATPLAAELPATWTGVDRTDYARICERLGLDPPEGEAPGPWISLTLAPSGSRRLSAHAGGSVIAAVRELGMGRIVVLPYDVRTLLALPTVEQSAAEEALEVVLPAATAVAWSVEDLWNKVDIGTWMTRTLQAGAFDPPPLPLVIVGILLYVVVVGPIDWFVLRRLRKERLTTLTFLGSVIAFTVIAYGASVVLFAAGSRVNRLVLVDLADAGRTGRQAMRVNELAGWYSSIGAEERVRYDLPALIGSDRFPGLDQTGSIGATLPLRVLGGDPSAPVGVLDIAFRSQRIVRGVCAGTYGPTIEVEWDASPPFGVRVVNGLPVDLEQVFVYVDDEHAYVLGSVPSGATSKGGEFTQRPAPRADVWVHNAHHEWGWGSRWTPSRAEISGMLESLTTGAWLVDKPTKPDADQAAALAKSGVSRRSAFARGRALVVALASQSPVPLPGAEMPGNVHVVIRKEVPIP